MTCHLILMHLTLISFHVHILDAGSRSKARIVQFMRHHMDTHIDDTELQNLLKKSQVCHYVVS